MPSARDVITAVSYVSPLERLEVEGRSARSRANSASTATGSSSTYTAPSSASSSSSSQSKRSPPPVPPLQLNLFRPSSVASIDTLSSFNSHNHTEYDYEEEGSPSTPKASKSGKQFFEFGLRPTISPTRARQESEKSRLASSSVGSTTRDSALTPKRSFTVTSRRSPSFGKPQPPSFQIVTQQSPPFQLRPVPGRNRQRSASDAHARNVPPALHPEETEITSDCASVHGEQGSDWGDDESQFEWVDTEGAPEAANGLEGRKASGGLSPTKRLSRFKSVVSRGSNSNGDAPKKLKKPLVIPRRAAPPPPPDTASAENIRPPTPSKSNLSKTLSQSSKSAPRQVEPPRRAGTLRATSDSARPPLSSRWTDGPSRSSPRSDAFKSPISPKAYPSRYVDAPRMVPLKDEASGLIPRMPHNAKHNSSMSIQSAYSLYDLDSDNSSPSTPRPEGEVAFPKGKYAKVSINALEGESASRDRTSSDASRTASIGETGRTPEDFVHLGIEARGKGDMPKSAWYFMKAAEGGSATGRMYWGLALRHGWGVARDEKHAFIELRQACNDSIAEGGLNFHHSPGAVKLTSHQKKIMTKDLAVGMFEVGNCFLDGVGVKKAPDVALQYLRFAANLGDLASQEQLGFVLSKGANGIKKDMKEAAKWYRMAISQGSSNTFGLAWVWKDKYMT
ncbi:hypothetical protein CI109_106903 [Kwoniella shandongensis]|uniref:Uncharacterized protein n=1 Tax=Kwoniella shandongensis TaxID=1734106 RepID=A0A5M6C733_9TREE|nr:uncharacterized protein CI109_000841 [Kwoniella shandongensis]KAA5530661.1 hypothetical protein CI109_000841 [Kwoniella shandongensis]